MFPPFITKRFGARNGVAIYSYIFTAFALASILGYVRLCFVIVHVWGWCVSLWLCGAGGGQRRTIHGGKRDHPPPPPDLPCYFPT